jgi:hypothetical protein
MICKGISLMESVTIHVRLSQSVHHRLKADAAKERRSVAGWAAMLLEDALGGTEAPPPPPIPARSDNGPDYSSHVAARDISHALALNGPSSKQLGQILETKLPAIRTLEAAVALGPQSWIDAGASETIIHRLFPGDEGAALAARKLRIKRASRKHYATHGRAARGHRIRQQT